MIGAIIGDIVGSKYEFNNTFDYNFKLFDKGCNFTDDTICTIAIADAILQAKMGYQMRQISENRFLNGVGVIQIRWEDMAVVSLIGLQVSTQSLMIVLEMEQL